MDVDSKRIVVSHGACGCCTASLARVYHRQYPTIVAEGVSVALAAERLLEDLTRTHSRARDPARREAIGRALADLRAFLSGLEPASDAAGGGTAEPRRAKATRRTGVINVRPLGPWLGGARATALLEGDGLEAVRLVVTRGKEIAPHTTRGEATVQCLEGQVAFTVNGITHELRAGDLLHLRANQPHSILGLDDASLLMTIALCDRPPEQSTNQQDTNYKRGEHIPADEAVDVASAESFPASDAPAWTRMAIGPPGRVQRDATSGHDAMKEPGDEVVQRYAPVAGAALSHENPTKSPSRDRRRDESSSPSPIPRRGEQERPMNADPKQIVVTESCCDACSGHAVLVHHHSFPEMRVEGMTAEMAAGYLANRLAAAHDNVADPAHREAIQSALTDTQAFLARKGPAHPGREVAGPHSS